MTMLKKAAARRYLSGAAVFLSMTVCLGAGTPINANSSVGMNLIATSQQAAMTFPSFNPPLGIDNGVVTSTAGNIEVYLLAEGESDRNTWGEYDPSTDMIGLSKDYFGEGNPNFYWEQAQLLGVMAHEDAKTHG